MSDGRFSSKPLRSPRSHESAWAAGEFTSDPRLLSEAARAFAESAVLLRELKAIDEPLPPVGVYVAPLHRNVPAGTKALGPPLASAVLVQEYLIGLVFLRVCGWIFLLFGALMILGSFIMMIVSTGGGPRAGDNFFAAVLTGAMGLGVGGAGVWFGILRGRVITEMCWFCPRGMIWMTENVFDWYTWEEVQQVHCRMKSDRPSIGIRFDENLSFITFSRSHESLSMVAHIEKCASSACAAAAVQLIGDGSSVRFGEWRLSLGTLRGDGEDFAWRDIADVRVHSREIIIRLQNGDEIAIAFDEVPFPSLFAALVRGIHAFASSRRM